MKAYYAIVAAVLLPITVMQAAERQVLHGHVPQAVANARVLGRVPGSERLNLAIGLPLRNQEGLELLLQQLYDPASPNYHQYQKPEQFAAQFGPTEHDYQTLIQFAESNGLVVTGTHPNRTILDVSGAIADIEHVFHLSMMSYWHPVRGTFYAPDREPSLDLDVPVLDISGLDNFEQPRPMSLKSMPLAAATPFVTGSGPAGLFIGGDFRAAYAPGVALNGSGQVVGLLEFDSFFANDVQANFKQAGLPAVPTQMVLLDSVSGVPGGGNIEVILDIMMASYMAPGLSKVMVYEGSTPNDVLNRMATDNLAQQLSSSWGYGPINASTEQIFKQYIAQGQSLLQASGDSGAYEGGVMTPSDDPSLTVVGGTSLTTSGSGGPWQSETTWPGSGGGISFTYPIPSYQQGTNMAVNGGSPTMRNIPDVALTADIQMFLICNNGQAISVGGTSAAAPLWAGFIALANQQALAGGKPSVGFLNPLIYSIGTGSNYSADFHDITLGNNYGFSAMSGYDLTTGWGTPAGQPLIDDLSGALASPAFTLSASPLTLSISPGSSTVSTLTIGTENGFSGSVSLAASGLPKGVTASFSPASTAGTSTLTVVAASSATAGTAVVMVTGTSGALKSMATISLTITAPNFTLAASPGSLSLAQGNSGTSTLTVGPQNGFSGSVSLAASGLPKGVTASFSPPSTAGASTLTLAASSSATAGAATVTVTGTSGSVSHTAAISLMITVPNFSLSASPSSLGVAQGSSGVSIVTIGPQSGFSGSVSFAASGLPSGVTASFSPATTTGPSTLTLAAGTSVSAGTSTVTVTGTSGALKNTVKISLTITVPNFSLSVSPSSLSLAQGGSGTSTITVGPQSGFGGSVSFTASGLPSGVTASFSPASTTGTSTLTFAAGTSVTAGTSTVTVAGTYGSLSHTAAISLTIIVPNFSLSASPSSLGVAQGTSGASTISVGAQSGFSGSVSLAASGLPSGVTASFSPASTTGASTLTLAAGTSAPPGTATITVTGTSGSLSHTATIGLTVIAPSAGATLVNLASAFNVSGIVTDGTAFVTGGLDGGLNGVATAYSANLLGAQKTISGTTFYFGPANAPDAVSSQTILLPPGQFATLQLLATAINGSQQSQTFTVTYADGTTSSFVQSLSDWFTPQSYAGESKAVSMAYRDTGSGAKDNRTFLLYGYSFALSAGKQVSSITLPNNRNVVVLAISLTGSGTSSTTAPTAAEVSLSPAFNITGISSDGKTFTGGLDGVGYAYSETLLGTTQTFDNTPFNIGPADAPDAVSANGKAIGLPAGQFSALLMLATGVNGSQTAQSFTITYSDGTGATFTQSLSDWFKPQNFAGESEAVTMSRRNSSQGLPNNGPFYLYGYSFRLNNSKTVSSITLPGNSNVKVFALTLVP
jgi:hypothetical protein